MSSILLTSSRKYPGIPTIDGDPRSHTRALEAIRDAIQIHERRSPDKLSSFVRVRELIDLGLVRLVGNDRLEAVSSASALADLTDVDLTGLLDGNTLEYDSAAGLWLPVAPSGGGSTTSLHDEIMADVPTAYWKCDETSGTTLVDSSGNGFDLTLTGTFVLASRPLVPSLLTTKFIKFGTSSTTFAKRAGSCGMTTPPVGDYTIEAVVQGAENSTWATIVSQLGTTAHSTEADNYQLAVALTGVSTGGSAQLSSFWENSVGLNNQQDRQIGNTLTRPVHVAIVKDGTAKTMSFYVNGIVFGSTTPTISYTTEPTGGGNVATFLGGSYVDSGGGLCIGYVAMYNAKKLTAARLVAHAAAAGVI